MNRIDETWHRLLFWTAGHPASERLAGQVLLDQGFSDFDPTHPGGGPDHTMDARCTYDDQPWIMAAYFPFGPQSFKDICDKFKKDLKGVAKNKAIGFAFVTNQKITLSERGLFCQIANERVELFHLERVTAILDQPRMEQVRQQFLGISTSQSQPNQKGSNAIIMVQQNAKIIQNISGDINNYYGDTHVGKRK